MKISISRTSVDAEAVVPVKILSGNAACHSGSFGGYSAGWYLEEIIKMP
ncbi:MAG: hypothetical protein LBJ72_14450 [Dysgonamonadaceae bacterium]|nr:hypothetical protein [Dysgonamonadaceae bacterium]